MLDDDTLRGVLVPVKEESYSIYSRDLDSVSTPFLFLK